MSGFWQEELNTVTPCFMYDEFYSLNKSTLYFVLNLLNGYSLIVLSVQLQYGPIAHIDLKIPPRPPGYAFVEVGLQMLTFFTYFFYTNIY